MPVCVPIKDMKDTASFAKTIENARGPVTVTKNGYNAFVVMKSADYEALQQDLAQTRLLNRMLLAEHEYSSGKYSDGDEFLSRIRESHGL